MSSPVKSYLKALLALSEDKTLESSRRSLLQSLSDADLQKVVQHGVGREFARGALEEIAVTILDVISREPQADYEDGATRDAPVKVEQEPDGDGDNIVVLAAPPQRHVRNEQPPDVRKQQDTAVIKTQAPRVVETRQDSQLDPQSSRSDGKRCSDASTDLTSVRKRAKNSPAPAARAQPKSPRVLRASTRSATAFMTNDTTPSSSSSSSPPKTPHRTQSLFPPSPRNNLPPFPLPITCNEVNYTTPAGLVQLSNTDNVLHEVNMKHTFTLTPAIIDTLASSRILIWFPKENQNNRSIQDHTGRRPPPAYLTVAFHANICANICENYLHDDESRHLYREMLEKRSSVISTECCVNDFVIRRSSTPSPRLLAADDLETACDECVANGRVCARFIKLAGRIELAVFPLPLAHRAGKQWMDFTCWVQK